MKRDVELARQLLLDIENRGSDCSVSVLRSGPNHQSDEQVRYHLRLLIDAGLLKEIDRTSAGVPCVRLTHDGHEFLELSRSESRWREAKYYCQRRLGGLSLTVIRGILLRWAVSATPTTARVRRVPLAQRVRYETDFPRDDAEYRVRPYRVEPVRTGERLMDHELWEDDIRYVKVRPGLDEYPYGIGSRYGIDLDGDGEVDAEIESTLPGYLI